MRIKPVPESFAERLVRIRESKEMSRYRLSKLSGVNESFLGKLERGEATAPAFEIVCRIADALGVGVQELRTSQTPQR